MRLFKSLVAAILLVALLLVIGGYLFAVSPLQLRSSPLDFEIPPGVGLRSASRIMADAGAGFSAWQFSVLGRVMGRAADIKAGSYEIETGVTPLLLLDKLTRGDVSQAELVLVEGKTFAQLRALLDAHPDLRHDSAGLSDRELLDRLGITAAHPEGLFAPDTYLFSKNTSDLQVLRRAHAALQQRLAQAWAGRAENLPYTDAYQALIMASIVEKETGIEADRPLVASVFLNRLRIGMPLQTDPAVIYGLGARFDGNLRKADLQADTPYNTYTRQGLPPTPISLPGVASLEAVLHPPASDKLYFVARGDGSSEFSRTLEEHNRAVARYQKRRGKAASG
jgi:UPF0755 protein